MTLVNGFSDGNARQAGIEMGYWGVGKRDRPPGDRKVRVDRSAVPGASEWVREKLGFNPDEGQALLFSTASKRGLLNCTRQWGKPTITAPKAVH